MNNKKYISPEMEIQKFTVEPSILTDSLNPETPVNPWAKSARRGDF